MAMKNYTPKIGRVKVKGLRVRKPKRKKRKSR